MSTAEIQSKSTLFLCAGAFVLSLMGSVHADYRKDVRPLLEKYCFDCHGEEKQKGRIRYDKITEFTTSDQPLWTMVHENLTDGEMPPEEKPQPSATEKKVILDWINEQTAIQVSKWSGTQRRLNRREFSAALQDLTGLPIDFGAAVPGDAKIDGFDTGAIALQDAADSVAQWLEVTRRAVESIRFLEPESDKKLSVNFQHHRFTDFRKWIEEHHKDKGIFTKSKRLNCKECIGVYLPTQWTGDRGNSFLAFPAPSDKRAALKVTFTVVANRPMLGLPLPMLWVKIGGKYLDYRPIGEKPETLTYAVRMEDQLIEDGVIKLTLRSMVEMPYALRGFENDDRTKPEDKIPGGIGIYRPKFDKKKLREPEEQPVPSIVIESLEVDYDHRALWPPASWGIDVGAITDSDESARRLLQVWIDRAWRRPAAKAEVARFFKLYKDFRGKGLSFDNALRSSFQSVLMGGPFRYLASPSDPDPVIAQHAVASRLSFMFLGAPPDEELRKLAAAGRLRDPKVLDAQVDRLLDDPRSIDFYRPFVTQWLNMNQPITLTMSHFKKQDFRFGRHMKASMKEETVRYVAKLFTDNRPASEFISSDWTMMNDILAVHYGIEGIEGGELRKVTVENRKEDQRGGGILGHAGIQSMLCWMGDNWVIYRGSWLLNHILDDPPPPPPLDVPELNPSEGANKGRPFRELLVQHQEDSRCSICHEKIDPLGFAFQNFDISGRWRNVEYHHYKRYELDGKIEWRGEGKTRPVDTVGTLPRGEKFSTYAEFKNQLAKHYLDDIVRGILKKLTLYGTGRSANVLDLASIRSIMEEHAKRNYPMRDLTKALVRSKVFLEPPQSVSSR